MKRMSRINEAYLLAALPLIGITTVAVHQMGRFAYYGVPLEYLELDTTKIILSGIPSILYALAGTYALVAFLGGERARTTTQRAVIHTLGAVLLTSPFWIGDLGIGRTISWATVIFIAFCAVVTFGAELSIRKRFYSQQRADVLESVGALSGVAFFVTTLLLLAAFSHGYLAARDMKIRTFIEGTDLMVVARTGDVLIAKKYDTRDGTFDSVKTHLVKFDQKLSLETRDDSRANR